MSYMSIIKSASLALLLVLLGCVSPGEDPAAYAAWKGSNFLRHNATQEGVVTQPSGLQYRVIQEGTGVRPGYRDRVTVHYRGTLTNGTEFDSSYKHGNPATFQLNRVIKGWTEGLGLMREGAKWELFIPSELAYGERGSGQSIGPNETLIFEVELIKVN